MRKPGSVKSLTDLGRVRLSSSFFMRDMLYSEIANYHGMPNIPDHPDLAIAAGTKLCTELLEPLQDKFGKISVRSAYRNPSVNKFGNENKLACARNEANYANHIWDYRDKSDNMGALATIVINQYTPYFEKTGDWESMAWYIHDTLPYSRMEFYLKLGAFNIGWRENPEKRIDSSCPPRRGCLTKIGMDNHAGDHSHLYAKMLTKVCKSD